MRISNKEFDKVSISQVGLRTVSKQNIFLLGFKVLTVSFSLVKSENKGIKAKSHATGAGRLLLKIKPIYKTISKPKNNS